MKGKNTVDKYIKVKNFLLELLFPKFCFGCNKEGSYLCEDCKSLLDICEQQYCLCNKNPKIIKGKCKKCQNKSLSGLYFALSYKKNPVIKKLIYQFKYEPFIKDLAETFAKIIAEHLIISKNNTEAIWQNSCFVPIPLDKKKLKWRNYNQAEELSKELSKIINVPVVLNNLVKTKSTLSQVDLSEKQREENIKDAFLIKDSVEIKDKKVFLVDDVYTTGSTMNECAKILKKAGVKEVFGITIARED